MSRFDGLGWVAWLVCTGLVCTGLGCGSATTKTATGSGPDAGADASAGACTSNADCMRMIPPTTPANCATASCNALEGKCVFSAKDDDGDGHTAADCKSTKSGVTVATGDDCNDHDANLYPGHPEACVKEEDGGTPAGLLCKSGQTTCLSDGTQSTCQGTVSCPNQVCVNAQCEGACAEGQTACSGNAVVTCSMGAWSVPAPCVNQTCIGTSVDVDAGADGSTRADGGNTGASCQGMCASGSAGCTGQQPETCDGTGTWQSEGQPCPSSQVCAVSASGASVTCLTGCEIGGATYQANEQSTTNACQTCQPTVSTSTWTNVTDGTACGSGDLCSAGVCGAQCDIGGMIYPESMQNPANLCQSCQPGLSLTAWTGIADGTACGTGEVCIGASCVSGCFVGGLTYVAGKVDAANPCQSCQPGTTTSAFTNVVDGTSCGNGQVCASGACGTQCDIAGMVYSTGTLNPSNACESCQPGVTTTAWTNVANGTGCAAGKVCDAGACGSSCYIAGMFYASGAADPGNSCQSCQPSLNTSGWSPGANGGACGITGETCSGGNCVCASPNTLCTTCTNTAADDGNCGACNHACSGAHATLTACAGSACVPTCAAGYSNCSKPAPPAADDGCECSGTCCGDGTCQSQHPHSDGFGQTFYDCTPLGTYNLELAEEACEAYPGGTPALCTACTGATTVSLIVGGNIVVWYYAPTGFTYSTGNTEFGPWTGTCASGMFTYSPPPTKGNWQ